MDVNQVDLHPNFLNVFLIGYGVQYIQFELAKMYFRFKPFNLYALWMLL